jgi:hypothetical protein
LEFLRNLRKIRRAAVSVVVLDETPGFAGLAAYIEGRKRTERARGVTKMNVERKVLVCELTIIKELGDLKFQCSVSAF